MDIRSQAQRAEQGLVPGALHVERNVLEWRFDPRSPARLPQAGYDLRVIVMCVEGYTSSLAAASLQDLGVAGATDLAGGFRAWQRAGLPVVMLAGHRASPGERPPGAPRWPAAPRLRRGALALLARGSEPWGAACRNPGGRARAA